MLDLTTLPDLVFLAIGILLMTALLRAIASGDPIDLGSMFAHPWDAPWPRGVQEEEPQPWRLERLDRRPQPVRRTEVAPSADDRDDADAWDAAA